MDSFQKQAYQGSLPKKVSKKDETNISIIEPPHIQTKKPHVIDAGETFKPFIGIPKPEHQTKHDEKDQKEHVIDEEREKQWQAQLELLKQQAHNEGFASGFSKGEKQGYDTAFPKGEKEGYDVGLSKGQADGYEEGLKRGHEEGIEQGRIEGHDIIAHMQGILTQMTLFWEELTFVYEDKIINLVCRIAEKVIYAQTDIDQEIVKRAIINAVQRIPDPVEITVQLNPEDYEYIELTKEDFFQAIKGLKQISVIADSMILRGGCRIETHAGEVDATLEARLNAVTKNILEQNPKKIR
ncbi:MAG: hypothetical protein HQK77_17390 [Desulfobacterales bacterium]|nr:hypothetical protein [Desulfobacterales bacterium]